MRKNKRYEILVGRGYFPEELPPPFITKPLADNLRKIDKLWPDIQNSAPLRYEHYSWPRLGHQRRLLAVTNPISQVNLSRELAYCWNIISKTTSKSKRSLSPITLSTKTERAIPKPNFDLKLAAELYTTGTYSATIRSDISRFYGTIYTHSIAWALHGKGWAKKNLHKPAFKTCEGNRIEKALTKGQDNQTIGIPIGPDTSRIISEIIGCAIDESFKHRAPSSYGKIYRYVDDWSIGVRTQAEAEHSLAILAAACADFELEINYSKTTVLEPSHSFTSGWTRELRAALGVVSRAKSNSNALHDFFHLAFRLAADNPTESVLTYALKQVRSITITQDTSKIISSYAARAVRAYPSCLPIACEILINIRHKNLPYSVQMMRELICYLLSTCTQKKFHGEVSWALFLAKGLSIKLTRADLASVNELESSICGLITLDLMHKGLAPKNYDVSLWESYQNSDGLHSPMWLLAYESKIKGWLKSGGNFVSSHKFFGPLERQGVYFYDEKRNSPTPAKAKRKQAIEMEEKATAADATNAELLSFFRQAHRSYY